MLHLALKAARRGLLQCDAQSAAASLDCLSLSHPRTLHIEHTTALNLHILATP